MPSQSVQNQSVPGYINATPGVVMDNTGTNPISDDGAPFRGRFRSRPGDSVSYRELLVRY